MQKRIELPCIRLVICSLVLAWALIGCTSNGFKHSTTLHKDIVGTWAYSTNSTQCTIVIDPDGTFSTIATNVDIPKEFMYEGKWEVLDNFLITTLTKTSQPKFEPVGRIDRYQIIRLTKTEMIYREEKEGQVISLKRKK
jgi:hypothetical protein